MARQTSASEDRGGLCRSAIRVVAHVFEDGDVPLIEALVDGRPNEMVLDTCADRLELNKLFYDTHAAEFAGGGRSSQQFYGSGGSARADIARLPTLTVRFAQGRLRVHAVPVLPQTSQSGVVGDMGDAGRSIWAGFGTATLDFRRRLLILRQVHGSEVSRAWWYRTVAAMPGACAAGSGCHRPPDWAEPLPGRMAGRRRCARAPLRHGFQRRAFGGV